ncbi:MAG: Tol-Pal system subunit TolQ, partial [Sphingomonas sp.]
MNPVFNMDAATMSPVALFLQADWVVKFVMGGLLLASIWTWAIIISFSVRLRRTKKEMARFERDFWKAEDIDAFHK